MDRSSAAPGSPSAIASLPARQPVEFCRSSQPIHIERQTLVMPHLLPRPKNLSKSMSESELRSAKFFARNRQVAPPIPCSVPACVAPCRDSARRDHTQKQQQQFCAESSIPPAYRPASDRGRQSLHSSIPEWWEQELRKPRRNAFRCPAESASS